MVHGVSDAGGRIGTYHVSPEQSFLPRGGRELCHQRKPSTCLKCFDCRGDKDAQILIQFVSFWIEFSRIFFVLPPRTLLPYK